MMHPAAEMLGDEDEILSMGHGSPRRDTAVASSTGGSSMLSTRSAVLVGLNPSSAWGSRQRPNHHARGGLCTLLGLRLANEGEPVGHRLDGPEGPFAA